MRRAIHSGDAATSRWGAIPKLDCCSERLLRLTVAGPFTHLRYARDGVTITSALDPVLIAGDQYWMTVFAPSSGNGVNWTTGSIVNPGTLTAVSDGGGTWSVTPTFNFDNGGFSVFSDPLATPDPTSWCLMLLAITPLLLLSLRARRV